MPHTTSPALSQLIQHRLTRRELLRHTALLGASAAVVTSLPFSGSAYAAESTLPYTGSLKFSEITRAISVTHQIAEGYHVQLILRWGDRLFADSPAFYPRNQTAKAQERQFGHNNDYIAYMPFERGSANSQHGFLCVNHEHTLTWLMFPGLTEETSTIMVSAEQVATEQAAQGLSVVEVQRVSGHWQAVIGSPYNRRITARSIITISGPAAGHERLKTLSDPTGREVLGTFGNCAGGITPWGTVLSAEENFHDYFTGDFTGTAEARNHTRYNISSNLRYGWHRFDPRFDVSEVLNEPNRFGWIVEVDPYDPTSTPIKRTALGRFKHESATTAFTADGRVVVYSGDDSYFEYLYRFVTKEHYIEGDQEHNRQLLDEGELSVAKLYDDGRLEWLPLVYGSGPLTKTNGFYSQADVVIEARTAADLLGATPMDRPEDIEVSPLTGRVYCTMTKNDKRLDDRIDAANPRAHNRHGHIIELIPPMQNGKIDHGAREFHWDIFLRGGDPTNPADGALYQGPVSANGWLSCPDNLAMDPKGRLWIATDGQYELGKGCDALYAADTEGAGRGISKQFFAGPSGAEITGPEFTPDGKTLFLSIQHPSEGKHVTFDNPTTRWPDFRDDMPPRPAIIAIVKKDGGTIGD